MSSAGQVVGGIVGGVVGIAFPVVGFALGASIGMAIGGYIDPPKGPKGRPPSASDLAVQTATYGAPLSDGYGTYGTLGNVFWVEGNTLRAEEHKAEGGKGGGATGPSTYDIFGTFAVGFGEGEIDGYGRIWFGSKLVCDFRSSDVGTIIATTENGGSITLYTGSASQLPDPRIQADMGAANTPAYRGLHYIVVSDWPMADYGNSLMGLQVKAEIVRTATFDQYARRVYVPDDLLPRTTNLPGASSTEYGYFNPRIDSGVLLVDKSNTATGYEYAYTWAVDFEGHLISQTGGSVDTGQFGYIGQITAGAVTYEGTYTGTFKVGGADFKLKTVDANNTCHGMAVGGDGRLYALERVAGAWLFNIYDGSDLSLVSSGVNNPIQLGDNHISTPCIPGTNITFCVEPDGVNVWTAQEGGGNSNFYLCSISASGDLTLTHNFNTAFLGTYGRMSAIVAANGLCYGVNNGGGFYIFDRNLIIGTPTVPLADIISARCLKTGLLIAGDIDVTAITQQVRGYKVPTIAAVRSSLEPLQAAWPFDVIPHGYQIKFVPRGGASVVTIDSDELGCVAGAEQSGVRITASREMDSQLPREVQVTYLDFGREYDPNTGPGAKRWNTDAVNVESLELAIVMSATEAAQTEEVLLYMRWLERHDVSFVLPPTHANLEPADVVTITSPTATYELRLVGINYLPDGRIECAAKFNNAAVYTSAAVAQEGLSTGQVLSFPGASISVLMDIPCVDSDITNKPGMLTALCGYSASWQGGTLFRSDDTGQTWIGAQGFVGSGCIFGTTINSIGSGTTHIIDEASLLTVRLYSGSLSGVSLSAMYSGANHFAYGVHGRWEIIAARTVADNGDGTFTVSGLLRGRFGTEHNMSLHAIGDTLALLDRSVVRFMGMGVDSINLPRLYRAVTHGQAIDSVGNTEFTYAGENLECLSPVEMKASKGTTNDWTISWTRRTRTPVEPFSGIAAPLAESSEAYEVEIWSDANYTTLIRTITGLTSASATYTSAQQMSDFGVAQKYLYIKVYQLSATVGRGHPAASVVGPTHLINLKSLIHFDEGGVEYLPYRVLALHCDGTNGSTTFDDVHGKTVTANGNAQISTAQYPALTGKTSSGYLDGSADYLSIPDSADFNLAGGDFSIKLKFRIAGWANNNGGFYYSTLISQWVAGDQAWSIDLMGTASSYTSIQFQGYDGSAHVVSHSMSFSLNTWYDLEVSRSGNTVYLILDGTVLNTGGSAFTYTLADSATSVKIGASVYDGTYPSYFNGYISEVEIIKGYALNTANYTPPGVPFSDSVPVITDEAGLSVTTYGSAATVSDSDSFGGRCLQANQSSGYVSIPVVDLTSLYWTVECFIKPGGIPSSGYNSGLFQYGTGESGIGGFCATIYSDSGINCIFEHGYAITAGNATVGKRVHVFVQRSGDRIYIGSDGIVGGNMLVSLTSFVGNKGFRIGYATPVYLNPQQVKIDEWRVTANEAKYPLSGTYSITTTQFPDP